jgi:hypothetical protein
LSWLNKRLLTVQLMWLSVQSMQRRQTRAGNIGLETLKQARQKSMFRSVPLVV